MVQPSSPSPRSSGRRPSAAPSSRGGAGARLGTLLGFCGWMLGLAVAVLLAGEPQLLWEVVLPGLLLSCGLAASFLVQHELSVRRHGPGHPITRLLLWGNLLLFVAMALLLANHWIAPAIEGSPALLELLGALQATYRAPEPLVLLALATGASLVGVALLRMLRAGGARPEAPPQEND